MWFRIQINTKKNNDAAVLQKVNATNDGKVKVKKIDGLFHLILHKSTIYPI